MVKILKKAFKKVTKPFTKVAKKVVPKELAGIMRVAAPFLPPGFREASYLLGTAKQTGRISPIDLALTALPYANKALGSQKSLDLMDRKGLFAEKLPGANKFLFGAPETTLAEASLARTPSTVGETTGILGSGGKMFQFGKDKGSVLDNVKAFRDQSKLGSLLLEGDKGTFSKSKVAGLGVGLLSLIQNSKTPDEAGNTLAQVTGDSDDYERGKLLFSQLTPELFAVPEEFRMNVRDGGIMRTDYAMGAGEKGVVNPFQPKPQGPVLPEEDKPFKPKPLKPIKMASYGYDDAMGETFEEFLRLKKIGEIPADMEFDEYLDLLDIDIPRSKKQKDREGIMMAGGFNDKYMSPEYEDEFKKFMMKEQEQNKELMLDDLMERFKQNMRKKDPILEAKDGGRANLALGTKPTTEESGLGGLPIEADMRYTGGFMPYGEKEKADDVPARLSKNEFVFTADAVRAAGGGSVNEGAKKMYQAMKQLEAKPEAKGMMA